MTGEETISSQPQADEQVQFSLGNINDPLVKIKSKTIDEINEQRHQEMFVGNNVESSKRQREEYAVQLRKAER